MNTKQLMLLCGTALCGLLIWRVTDRQSLKPPIMPSRLVAEQESAFPNTLAFWQQWAQHRAQHDEAVDRLREREIPRDAWACGEADDALANQTEAIAREGVDPELISLSDDFIAFYRQRAESWRAQAILMQRAESLSEAQNSSAKMVEAFIRGAMGDPFGVAVEQFDADQELRRDAEQFLMLQQQLNRGFQSLAAKRERVYAKLVSQFGSNVPR